jgi:tRNA(Ile)-lysidine synthase
MGADSTRIPAAAEGVLHGAGLLGGRVTIALSGGLDSVVLLHCLTALAPSLGLEIGALHVHHGLSPKADQWARFCAELCERVAVPLAQAIVAVDPDSGLGVEAAAREARYAVFRRQKVDAVALAHHRDDQAETVLLQLLRGAGVRGLSAMPPVRVLDPLSGLRLVRPLLDVPRAAIRAYARAHKLSWIEDESNADARFDRNFLRSKILPGLTQRFPAAAETLSRVALNLADAQSVLDEVAALDAQHAVTEEGLDATVLAGMSAARARNLLRWFLEREGLRSPNREQLEEALRQALTARADARLQVKVGDGWLRRHRGRLCVEADRPQPAATWSVAWGGERELRLPAGLGSIRFEQVVGTGLSLAGLRAANVVVKARAGSERMRLAPGRPSRTLKNLLRESAVPAWERDRLPLLFAGDALVWAPGVGEDWRYAAAAGEAGVLPRWDRAWFRGPSAE